MWQSFIEKILGKFRKRSLGEGGRGEVGRRGEDLAADYLKKEKGYKVVARNWRYKSDEIDIVARDGEVLVFLEVKASTNEGLVPVYYKVTRKKKTNLARACKGYLKMSNPRPRHFRFDIVTVKLCQEGKSSIEHYTNVKLFSKNFHTLSDD